MGFFDRFKRLIALAVAVALLVALISFSQRERERFWALENAVGEITSPVMRVFSEVNYSFFRTAGFFRDLVELYGENKRLKKEVANLRKIEFEYNELKAENQRLKQLLSLNETKHYKIIANANVVGRDPSNWAKFITIDKGRNSGISVNCVVVTNEGLVGRVVSVSPHTAKVLLITDAQSGVGGRVQRSRDMGIIEGSLEELNYLQMVNIPRDADIKEGDLIITSGLGGIFPPGIPIGKVEEVLDEGYGLLRRASISPSVRFNRLEEVVVIKGETNSMVQEGEE